MSDKPGIKAALSDYLGESISQIEIVAHGGGDTHKNYRLSLGSFDSPVRLAKDYFVKVNDLSHQAVLKSEYQSLRILKSEYHLAYPEPVHFYCTEEACFMIMQYVDLIDFSNPACEDNSQYQLGIMLARQHQIKSSEFGWASDNYIGLTPQQNTRHEDWQEFYRERRLRPQYELAKARNLGSELCVGIKNLMSNLHHFFASYQPIPSLLHGDLWTGNAAYNRGAATPMLYDPAPYFGDRECDIAMTQLFGGFAEDFYTGYQSIWPLDTGYDQRRSLYNLYHALNHFNLFGSAYTGMVREHLTSLDGHY